MYRSSKTTDAQNGDYGYSRCKEIGIVKLSLTQDREKMFLETQLRIWLFLPLQRRFEMEQACSSYSQAEFEKKIGICNEL